MKRWPDYLELKGMNLGTVQMRYFLALCRERNFTRAAKRCEVSQPTLSIAIKTLELELGGLLIDRRCMNLTLLAERVRPHFASAVASVRRIKGPLAISARYSEPPIISSRVRTALGKLETTSPSLLCAPRTLSNDRRRSNDAASFACGFVARAAFFIFKSRHPIVGPTSLACVRSSTPRWFGKSKKRDRRNRSRAKSWPTPSS